jgi:hypothetical protein
MLEKLRTVSRTEVRRLRADNAKLLEALQLQQSNGDRNTAEVDSLQEAVKVSVAPQLHVHAVAAAAR